jgi:hypothetical protein
MARADAVNIRLVEIEPNPIEIDPRPCGECGLTIDRHERVDTPEGPEYFCVEVDPNDLDMDELERRAELRRQEEVAVILARMDAMEAPAEVPPAGQLPTYRTAASTIDAFWCVASLRDPERLRAWLLDRPKDAPTLLKLMESK